MDDSERPERPPPDADASEIAEWMEEDFGRAVAERMANAGDEDEHRVVKVEILNHERGEVVGIRLLKAVMIARPAREVSTRVPVAPTEVFSNSVCTS